MTAAESNLNRYHPLASEARFAARLARALDDSSRALPAGVEERLRVAREQALTKARREPQRLLTVIPAGIAGMGWSSGGWWSRVALLLPVAALAVGLFAIEQKHREAQIAAAVEIDAALLTDDAPLAAYRDAGFVEFLKSPAN